jgi:hypothetical protein
MGQRECDTADREGGEKVKHGGGVETDIGFRGNRDERREGAGEERAR